MALSVKGCVVDILKEETGTSKAGKEWKSRSFVIETAEQFPKKVCFTCFGEKSSLINAINNGDNVEVHFNVESREYNGRWFHQVNAWKIDVEAKAAPSTGLHQPQASPMSPMPEDGSDVLPF